MQWSHNNRVCIVQAWAYAHAVGELNVLFDAQGDVESCEGTTTLLLGNTFLLDSKETDVVEQEKILEILKSKKNIEIVSKDEVTLKALEPFKSQIEQKAKEVVGYSKSHLTNKRVPDSINPQGSDLAPLVCKAFMLSDANADVCIQNAGAVRTSLDAGEITIEIVYALLPFKSTLFEIKMKGSEIKEVLEDALSNYYDAGGSSGSFPYSYALRYDINATQSKNNRISNVQIMEKESGIFESIKNDKLYTVVTNSYTAEGRDGYATFARVQSERGEGVDTYLDYAMSFIDFLKAQKEAGEELEKLSEDRFPIRCYSDALFSSCDK